MTSEAPKEMPVNIWAGRSDGVGGWHEGQDFVNHTSYTLTTHAQAMVAAAYENATEVVAHDYVCDAIRARTPDDAQAALDALLKAERVKALRDAADCIGHITQAEDRDAILALIEGDRP